VASSTGPLSRSTTIKPTLFKYKIGLTFQAGEIMPYPTASLSRRKISSEIQQN
jgi:hypothetical protein